MAAESAARKRWREWGKGDPHWYIQWLSERYVEGENCAECGALSTAPWHLSERRKSATKDEN